MRAAVACLVLSSAVACLVLSSLACSRNDPDLARDCAHRRPAKVEVGTGQYQFILLGKQGGPLIETDLQAGDYLWFAVGCQGLGPDVTIDFGIQANVADGGTDGGADGGIALSTLGSQRVPLSYDSSLDLDEAYGLQAFFVPFPAGGYANAAQLVNQTVTLWTRVTDGAGCYKDPIEAQVPTTIGGFDTTTCVGCLAEACAPQLAACGPGSDCLAVQACLDSYCANLSTIASPDEVACQAWCQGQHAGGRDAHVALVGCVQSSMCEAPTGSTPAAPTPCYGYSIDYRHCTGLEDDPSMGPCKDKALVCAGGDCLAYKNCINACTTWASCQLCAQQHPNGETQFEAHQLCLETACILQGWLPHM
jgi:hypothetical protein